MKIVLAFDSFKGSLSADIACREAALALAESAPTAQLLEKPMADGGEGAAAALLAARGGEWIPMPVTGPLPDMTVDAGYARLADGRTAVVEMAAASGLTLLRPNQLNPLAATTLGTGELLRAALESGAESILLAAGGSATVDGGTGMAHALGWRFLDATGRELPPNGASLERIAAIRPPAIPAFKPGQLVVLSDVTNPLCGPRGAARTFGPQKGATPEMVERLDAGLANLALRLREHTHFDLLALRGGGAAGGLAAGAAGFFGAVIQSGVDTIMQMTALSEALAGADWVITGEGAFDTQSLEGKVISGVARLAMEHGAKIAVFAGRIALEPDAVRKAGIDCAHAITPAGMPPDEAIRLAPHLLRQAIVRFAEEWL